MKTIQVKVKPNARVSILEEAGGGPWLAQLKSPPVDGKANREIDHVDRSTFRMSKVSYINQERRLWTDKTGEDRE